MHRPIKALVIFLTINVLASGSALAADPIRLAALIALMDQVQPDAAEGWSTEVNIDVCADFDPQVVVRERSTLLVSVEEKKIAGKSELHKSRGVWFLRGQKLVVSGYQDGDCDAWIYVKPPLG